MITSVVLIPSACEKFIRYNLKNILAIQVDLTLCQGRSGKAVDITGTCSSIRYVKENVIKYTFLTSKILFLKDPVYRKALAWEAWTVGNRRSFISLPQTAWRANVKPDGAHSSTHFVTNVISFFAFFFIPNRPEESAVGHESN